MLLLRFLYHMLKAWPAFVHFLWKFSIFSVLVEFGETEEIADIQTLLDTQTLRLSGTHTIHFEQLLCRMNKMTEQNENKNLKNRKFSLTEHIKGAKYKNIVGAKQTKCEMCDRTTTTTMKKKRKYFPNFRLSHSFVLFSAESIHLFIVSFVVCYSTIRAFQSHFFRVHFCVVIVAIR